MWRGDEENPSTRGRLLAVGLGDRRGAALGLHPARHLRPGGGHRRGRRHLVLVEGRRGRPQYPIGEGKYLTANASSVTFETTITLNADGTWSYDETTKLRMKEMPELLPHTDHNTLHKVG